MRIDTIPPKITKMLNDNICNNIESIANSMITQTLFPDQAKYHQLHLYFKKTIEWRKRNTDQLVFSLAF